MSSTPASIHKRGVSWIADRLALTPARAIVIVIAVLALAPFGVSQYFATDVLTRAMLLAILALALDLSWGYGGILSLGHSAFFGIGSYAMAIVLLRWDASLAPYIGFVLAIVLPALLAAVVGLFVFYGNTSSLYVAIVTLSLPVLLSAIVLRIPKLTGGLTGLSGVPMFPWYEPLITYYLILGALVTGIGLVFWITHSDFGRLLIAVRDNEQRARFLGYDTSIARLIVFSTSGALAGFAGALYAPYNGFVASDLVGLVLSTSAIVWVAIGGRGTIAGPLIGALLVNALEPTLNAAFPGIWLLFLGLVFIVVILLFPSGLYGLVSGKHGARRSLCVAAAEAASATRARMTLSISGLRLAFGSLTVIRDLSIEMGTGTLHCLIGPNGAGKSTLVNAVTGLLRANAGQISVDGVAIQYYKPDRIVRLGVMRTFQASNVFETLSVGDNLFLARGTGGLSLLTRRSRQVRLPTHCLRVLELSGLEEKLDVRAGELGHGERKWLELCMVLAAEPAIIFLDEPTAGLTASDRAKAGEVLKSLVHDHGLGLLLIEHDLEFVKSIAERLTVLSSGEVVADGSVDQVADSPVVRQIYIGQGDRAVAKGSG